MHIALISISNITANDEKLLAIGLNLPGFVARSKAIASLPHLGLLTLAGMIPEEHQVSYFDLKDASEIDQLPNGIDLAAITSFTALIDEAYKLSSALKAQGVKTVLGGLHVSMEPDEARAYANSIVVGEGEAIWATVIQDAEANRLKPRYDILETEFDLEEAPLPAFHLLKGRTYNRITVQTSRGCPFRCEFCGSSPIMTRQYKHKPIHKVLTELELIKTHFKRPFIEFVDDNAFVNHEYWKELLPHLKKLKIRWFAETDISISKHLELLKMMKDSGCAQILIGLESPTQAGLENIEMKSNWKWRQWDHYADAIQSIQSEGIRAIGCFIVGLDGHTLDIFNEVYEFSKALGLFDVQVTLPTAFPGTPFYERLKKENRLLEPRNWKRCTLFDVNFKPSQMTVEELEEGFRNLMVRLYSQEALAYRNQAFIEQYKRGRMLSKF